MMDTYKLSEIRSFRRARQIVGAVTMLFALTLAGPPRLRGQCALITNVDVAVSPATVIAGQNITLTLTFTLNVPVSACNTWFADYSAIIWRGFAPNGQLLYVGEVAIPLGGLAQGERSPAICSGSGKAVHGQDGRVVPITKPDA